MLKIAILSDLHLKADEDIDQNRILNNIINHFDEEIAKANWIDIVLVTGDITFSGKKEEFVKALRFFNNLRLSLDIPKERFIFVPGNHDYSRDDRGEGFKDIKKINSKRYKKILNSSDFSSYAKKAFKNFLNFIDKFKSEKYELKGFQKIFDFTEYLIHIYVLNSCLTNLTGDEKFPSYIDCDHFKDFQEKENVPNLNIFLMHHPLDNLYIENKRELSKILYKYCDIFIAGHEHLPDYGTKGSIDGNEYISIVNGSTFLEEKYNLEQIMNRFVVIEYDSHSTTIIVIPWFTKANIKHCGRDTSLFPSAKVDGVFKIKMNYKKGDIVVKDIQDPLQNIEIPDDLFEFFIKDTHRLFDVNDKASFLNLRKKIKNIHSYQLSRIAICFLKYLINENLIEDFKDLIDLLKNKYIFSRIERLHDDIINYYDRRYFKIRHRNIEKIILHRKKDKNVSDLKRKLSQTKEELERLKLRSNSIIENYKKRSFDNLPSIPSFESYEYKEYIDWYKSFGLKSDPFPSRSGFENIDDDLYEDIIVLTPIIEMYKKIIISDNLHDLINKTIGIYGEYGSGKTTLFQYLGKLLSIYHSEILIITIPLDARDSLKEIRRKFFIILKSKLKRVHLEYLNFTPPEYDLEEDCVSMLKNLSEFKKVAFLVIEDIYKHSSLSDYIKEVIEFITEFQVIRKDFTDRAIPTSIFFSSIKEIIDRIQGRNSTSGGIDQLERMPAINIDTALKMINVRLRAFSVNKEEPKSISKEFLQKAVQIARHVVNPIRTFRNYIDVVKPHFRRLEFTPEAITIYSVGDSISNLLNDIQKNHFSLHDSFNKIKGLKGVNREVFERFIKLLEEIWQGELIVEGSSEFIENKLYLIYLNKLDLLKQIQYQFQPSWTLSDKCEEYFDKIYGKFSLFPSNIIPAIYFPIEEPEIIENKNIKDIDNILKRGEVYGLIFKESLNKFFKSYQKINKFATSDSILKKQIVDYDLVEEMINSFQDLIIAIVAQCDQEIKNYTDALLYYEKSWYENIETITFNKRINELQVEKLTTTEDFLQFLSDYLSINNELITQLKKFVRWDSIFSLKNRVLWNSDKKILNSIRRNIINKNFKLSNEKIRILLKDNLISLIYNYSQIIYGIKKWKRAIPQEINLNLKEIRTKLLSNLKISNKNLLLKLSVEELFIIIDFLDDKLDNKIEFVSEVNYLCKNINKHLNNDNIWINDILRLLEILNKFNELLLVCEIPTPWNSDIFKSISDIKLKPDFINQEIDKILIKYPILLDRYFLPIEDDRIEVDKISLIYWLINNCEKLKISFDYKLEKIIIYKK